MRAKALLMALAMMTTALAGCSGDPDGGGNDEFDAATLQGMIEAGLQDFMNNTTVDITTVHYNNETSTTTNYINGSGGSSTTMHVLTGTSPGESSFDISYSPYQGIALLVRGDAYSADGAGNSAAGLNGANICVGIGTTTEGILVDWFSSRNIEFTSVPVADDAEATAKLIDGSCDALVDDRVVLQGLKIYLDGDGSMNGVDIWITIDSMGATSSRQVNQQNSSNNSVVPIGDGWSVLNITLSQDHGEMSSLHSAYAMVNVTGVCVSNCSNQSDGVFHGFEFYWLAESPWLFWSPYGEVLLSTECEMGFDSDLQFETQFGPPGLSCELDLMMLADFSVSPIIENIDDYEFEWGDWTYHIMWLSAPVQME